MTEGLRLLPPSTDDATPTELDRARAVLALHRARAQAFAPVRTLFHDPAWDIMLALFIAQEQDVSLSLGDVGDRVALNPEATRRWLLALEQTGIINCWPPNTDYDSRSAGLTADATAMMLRFLDAT